MNYGGIWALFLAIFAAVYAATNYCDDNLCDEGKTHIACGNDWNIDPNCLGKHNLLRNKIAKGFADFPPARHMATMVWDNELAMLAELNVKQCEMRRDQCRNTPKFSFAGQNLDLRTWRGLNFTVSEVINTHIQAWFNEYIHCPYDIISSYKFSYRTAYDRFTTMMQDKSTLIGCAILRSFSGGFKQQLMACNYAYDNVLGDPVYISGYPTSLCMTGKNTNIDPNCLLPLIVPMTPGYRRQIVGKHNLLRNKIAKGFAIFPPAKHMATMVWDNELSMLAELNVKQCEVLYDECHNTPRFLFSGQNIALTGWSGYDFTASDVISIQIQVWFNEYKNCPLNVLSSYKSSNRTAYGRFTTMMQDKYTHVGCANLRRFSEGSMEQIMACNYAYTNIWRAPVYNQGQSASLCMTGTNKRFTSLCSVRERYK